MRPIRILGGSAFFWVAATSSNYDNFQYGHRGVSKSEYFFSYVNWWKDQAKENCFLRFEEKCIILEEGEGYSWSFSIAQGQLVMSIPRIDKEKSFLGVSPRGQSKYMDFTEGLAKVLEIKLDAKLIDHILVIPDLGAFDRNDFFKNQDTNLVLDDILDKLGTPSARALYISIGKNTLVPQARTLSLKSTTDLVKNGYQTLKDLSPIKRDGYRVIIDPKSTLEKIKPQTKELMAFSLNSVKLAGKMISVYPFKKPKVENSNPSGKGQTTLTPPLDVNYRWTMAKFATSLNTRSSLCFSFWKNHAHASHNFKFHMDTIDRELTVEPTAINILIKQRDQIVNAITITLVENELQVLLKGHNGLCASLYKNDILVTSFTESRYHTSAVTKDYSLLLYSQSKKSPQTLEQSNFEDEIDFDKIANDFIVEQILFLRIIDGGDKKLPNTMPKLLVKPLLQVETFYPDGEQTKHLVHPNNFQSREFGQNNNPGVKTFHIRMKPLKKQVHFGSVRWTLSKFWDSSRGIVFNHEEILAGTFLEDVQTCYLATQSKEKYMKLLRERNQFGWYVTCLLRGNLLVIRKSPQVHIALVRNGSRYTRGQGLDGINLKIKVDDIIQIIPNGNNIRLEEGPINNMKEIDGNAYSKSMGLVGGSETVNYLQVRIESLDPYTKSLDKLASEMSYILAREHWFDKLDTSKGIVTLKEHQLRPLPDFYFQWHKSEITKTPVSYKFKCKYPLFGIYLDGNKVEISEFLRQQPGLGNPCASLEIELSYNNLTVSTKGHVPFKVVVLRDSEVVFRCHQERCCFFEWKDNDVMILLPFTFKQKKLFFGQICDSSQEFISRLEDGFAQGHLLGARLRQSDISLQRLEEDVEIKTSQSSSSIDDENFQSGSPSSNNIEMLLSSRITFDENWTEQFKNLRVSSTFSLEEEEKEKEGREEEKEKERKEDEEIEEIEEIGVESSVTILDYIEALNITGGNSSAGDSDTEDSSHR